MGVVGRVELARAWVVGLGVVLGWVREVTCRSADVSAHVSARVGSELPVDHVRDASFQCSDGFFAGFAFCQFLLVVVTALAGGTEDKLILEDSMRRLRDLFPDIEYPRDRRGVTSGALLNTRNASTQS